MAMCRWCIRTKSGKVVNILNRSDSSISHRCLHNSFNAFQQSTGRLEADALINISHQQNFEADYASSHIPTSTFQKIALFFGSSAVALMDPSRGDMIATLGETGGEGPIKYMQQKMLQSGEGKQILMEKPRINSGTVDLQKLRELPEGSLGRIYTDFLDKNKVGPDSRLMVQFIDDVELAYVIQRYREVHDLVHAILGMPTNMLGEVTVKWIEAIQNKLPMCVGGAVFGAIRLAPKQRKKYVQYYLPWAIKTGLTSEFLLNIYFEKRWEQQVSDLLNEVHITPLKIPKT
ncbi:ubiquinone biosynthesis protein COQ4 homolog, mitochondrial isoform X2 [Schistocerca nitens]|uniref:ubiquinone biosynthesis protein COQ4 homolog, mitochondrial isoform X1 n=1 Tax=Schistocerca cancellata TaxID=274614 RepID=UPI002117A7FB|nr:ubiquinone biosynthesis protein COQ4 homolog, mitochondrial isoform X1 [Schistocerca cancellata]XP_049809305.1 ubiquinone biosynthesis protein COQ4 homolog, mitochondrial isoform X2 [Schistocerca nitens]